MVATTDPATLPPLTTWYLATTLPRPTGPRATESPFAPADLAEVVRLYGLRNWVEQGYKQVKDELGWADFQVCADRAIRRHWTLVHCAFSFCWRAWFAARETAWPPPPPETDLPPDPAAPAASPAPPRWPIWPVALRHVRSWLVPWTMLWRIWRIWRIWSTAAPPLDLRWLLDLVGAGYSLPLSLRC